jgi:hypothetical protein
MNQLLVGPLLALFLSGFTLELLSIAEDMQHKVLDYADHTNSALDCAFAGVDIRKCSPNILEVQFEGDLKSFDAKVANNMANMTKYP